MNQRNAKRLRKLISPQDTTSKKVYRRLKKNLQKISSPQEKEDFFAGIETLINSTENIKL